MKKRILFVDDDRRGTEIYVEMLRMEDYDVTFAATIREAEDKFKFDDITFDLVILDIMIPYGNYFEENSFNSRVMGLRFLKNIREQKNKEELPVIILTVYSDEVIKKQAYDTDCNEYLEKPCLPSKLLEKVKNNLK